MTKHRFRESIKSLFGSHIDHDKYEELKGTKIEMDGKVQKILKLLKGEGEDDKNALIRLIEDFHKHYQSVYDRYDHLTGDLRKKVHGKKGKDDSSSSSSDSDSDSDYSSKKKGSKNGKLHNKVADGILEELQTANTEILDLKTKFTMAIREKETLDSEYQVALNKIQEADKIFGELKLEADRLSDENPKLLLDNSNLKLELEEAGKLETELNEKIEAIEKEKSRLILEKDTEMGMIEEEKKSNAELGAIISQLKDEKEAFKLQLEDVKGQLKSTEEEVLVQIESLKEELANKTTDQERVLEEKEVYMAQVKDLELEIKSLQDLKLETEMDMEKKNQDILKFLTQIESLKEELTSKTKEHKRVLKDKEEHFAKVNVLELELASLVTLKNELEKQIEDKNNEVDSLKNQKSELKDQVFNTDQEIDRLREENEDLQRKISELDSSLKERAEEFFALETKLEDVKNEGSAQIEALSDKLNSLLGEKTDLELLIQSSKRESSESLTEVENKNIELACRVEEQVGLIKSLEGDLSKLKEDHRQLEAALEQCKEKRQVAEQRADKLEEIVDDLKRDIEVKGDEFNTMVDIVRNLEVKVRLSNQKLRITDQLLNEKEDDHASKEKKFQQENKSLLEKISVLYSIISGYKESEGRVMTEISKKVNSSLDGMDALTMKFEEDYGHIETCVYEIMNEIQVVKSWVKEVNSERQKLKHTVQDKEEQELVLREKVGILTAELVKDEAEKKNLMKTVTRLEEKNGELEKAVNEKDQKMREFKNLVSEKNEGILCLGEEKREVIRQLCIWSDYQREHYNHLKEMLSRNTTGPRQVSR